MDQKQQPSVCVLLSTYNGEKYLSAQLDSILLQQDVVVKLLIRDDGSSDSTINIIEQYTCEHPTMITFLKGDNLGWKRSYFELLKVAPEADFYSYADQDDVWLPEKLSRATDMLKSKRNECALYAGNVWITDENLKIQKTYCPRNVDMLDRPLATIAAQSYLPGGLTFVFTKTAKNMLLPLYPGGKVGHDTWAFKLCLYYGSVVYDEMPTVYYRQHENNVVGASRGAKWWIEKKLQTLFGNNNDVCGFVENALLEHFYNIELSTDVQNLMFTMRNYKKGFKSKMALISFPDFKRNKISTTLLMQIKILIGKY